MSGHWDDIILGGNTTTFVQLCA
ncbi:MAG: hypothetical protein ABS251_02145 [Wolbachia endosymbiont of Ephestia elutella]|uniref:Uncharacterized protein n=1 Tax=Wolbachia endosymbiont of Ephestia elutella TaxID=3231696 RepID=A0AAU8MLI1_9RICK|nr:hypothetical protein [Wolbachia endosymbiont of Tribolium confusum]UIP92158.1 hypothetical protein IYZ83_000330 [Wolbachia pipientis]